MQLLIGVKCGLYQIYSELITTGAKKADFYLLRRPHINVHDVNAKRSADTKLAIEKAKYLNEACPYGRKHKHNRTLRITFRCKICEECKVGALGGYTCGNRQCMELHLRSR
jgi:hypothetical protein